MNLNVEICKIWYQILVERVCRETNVLHHLMIHVYMISFWHFWVFLALLQQFLITPLCVTTCDGAKMIHFILDKPWVPFCSLCGVDIKFSASRCCTWYVITKWVEMLTRTTLGIYWMNTNWKFSSICIEAQFHLHFWKVWTQINVINEAIHELYS